MRQFHLKLCVCYLVFRFFNCTNTGNSTKFFRKMIQCAYCDNCYSTFDLYKYHLKVLHNKKTSGDKIVCGQGGCPLDYNSFQALKNHCVKYHKCNAVLGTHSPSIPGVPNNNEWQMLGDEDNIVEEESLEVPSESISLIERIRKNNGVFEDAAFFISRLRSHSTMPLSTSLEVVDMCSDLVKSILSEVYKEALAIFCEYSIDSDSSRNLLSVMQQLLNPFAGLETLYKQTKYFENVGSYIAPKPFTVGHTLEALKSDCSDCSAKYKTKVVYGEHVSQKSCLKTFLSLPGVFEEIKCYLNEPAMEDIIGDFKDGDLWRNHPLRLKFAGCPNTLVIPVFDYFDDVEVANPLGSHATIHKLGAKYTVLKCYKPQYNSLVENIFLNTLIYSSDRVTYSNKEVFEAYLTEMFELESKGFDIIVDGLSFKIYVVLVQVSGDNLGLNGTLGYVESFTANFPCRICKTQREHFSVHLFESEKLLRNRDCYKTDLLVGNSKLTGIKEECCYNRLKYFHVADNVYCDIMHDLFEGVCRYVIQKLFKYLIHQQKYFTLENLSRRMQVFIYDHSSAPPCPSYQHVLNESINIGAIEMLNLVLGLPLLIGDLVPVGDRWWEVFLLLRKVILYACGLQFTKSELEFMRVLIAEFLEEYISIYECGLSLKFHNLTHYPSVIKQLGPLYNIWAMRCEAKHAESKKVASSVGNFRNICKTVAVRHQMRQAARFLARRGLEDSVLSVSKCTAMMLYQTTDGATISSLLGNYGLFREIFQTNCISLNSVEYRVGDILAVSSDGLFPVFMQIHKVFITDARECQFVGMKLITVGEIHHFQAYEVEKTSNYLCVTAHDLNAIISPWPLHCRSSGRLLLVSLRHKLWYVLCSHME